MVDQEAVRLMVGLAILPQALANRLAFLAGIGEDQALLPPRMLKNIAHPWISGLRSGVCGVLRNRCFRHGPLPFIGLRRGVEEMLHGKTPDLAAAVKPGDHRAAAAARSEKTPGGLRIANGSGKADPAGTAAGRPAQPLNEAKCLHAAVAAKQGMNLVDHNETQIPKKRRDLHVLVDQQRFQ